MTPPKIQAEDMLSSPLIKPRIGDSYHLKDPHSPRDVISGKAELCIMRGSEDMSS